MVCVLFHQSWPLPLSVPNTALLHTLLSPAWALEALEALEGQTLVADAEGSHTYACPPCPGRGRPLLSRQDRRLLLSQNLPGF